MSQTGKKDNLRCLPPADRVKKLTQYSDLSNIQDISNFPAINYFRSGTQMIKMAEECLRSDNLEDAFIYYMRFITLFVEKINHHPDYKTVPPEMRSWSKKALKQAIPVAEELKKKLHDHYALEYEYYLKEKEREELLMAQKRREEEEQRKQMEMRQQSTNSSVVETARTNNSYLKESSIKQVPYLPDDFLVYELPESKPSTPSNPVAVKKPGFDRSTKPQYNTFKDKMYTSFLKTVIIPSRMLQTFLVLSEKNTNNNVETCGILAGRMKSNMLIITHLLIPKQYGNSDSCTTDNEEDLFNYQNEHNLLTLGWIHTHPSQTAFLSSVDLHTHYSYQLMLSEAIAIVCAPSYNEIRFFRLTSDYGLNFIGNCKQKGFHPHPSDPPLFQDAEHCEKDDSIAVEVVDFRG